MEYNDAIEILSQLAQYRRKLGNRAVRVSGKFRTQEWLKIFGVNEEDLKTIKFIHVAGTKGKGTTCLYCERLLLEYQKTQGVSLKIGCLTSPHITKIRDRIKIDSAPITEQMFAFYFFKIWKQMDWCCQSENGHPIPEVPLFPGFMTLLALYIFVKEKVTVAVVETGIGGEFDSTNAIPCPVVTGITTIGIDHIDVLGTALKASRGTKLEEPVFKVLCNRALEKQTLRSLSIVRRDLASGLNVTVEPDMDFQKRNASLAIALAEAFLKSLDPNFAMTVRMAKSMEDTKLSGRNVLITRGKIEWYIDTAHNELSIGAACACFKHSVEQSKNSKVSRVLLFSDDSTRDVHGILEVIHESVCGKDGIRFDYVYFSSTSSGLEECPDFFYPKISRDWALAIPRRHAMKWKDIDPYAEVITTQSVKAALDSVESLHSSSGALVFVVGDVRQAGVTLHVLGADD